MARLWFWPVWLIHLRTPQYLLALLVPTSINRSIHAMSAIPTIPVPIATIIKAKRVAGGSVEGVIRRDLKVEIANLILIVHSSTAHSHSQPRSLLSLRFVDKGGPVWKVFVVVHTRDSFKQCLGEFDATLLGRAIV